MSQPNTIEEFEREQMHTLRVSPLEYASTFQTIVDPLGYFSTRRRVALPSEDEISLKAKAEAEGRERLKAELRAEIAGELAVPRVSEAETEATQ